MTEDDFLLQAYDYDLPEERIAQYPCGKSGSSRLLVMDRYPKADEQTPVRGHASFALLPDLLPQGCLLVANNTRVLPARLPFLRSGGGKGEFLLLTPLPLLLASAGQNKAVSPGEYESKAIADCLIRPAARIRIGDSLNLTDNLCARVLEKGDFGRHKAELRWNGSLEDIFTRSGSLPLPPYIHRLPEESDLARYQTVYAANTGAVAAPTAGLHFTGHLLAGLKDRGFGWCEICLHVGYGTFSPVRCADIRDHRMHAEYVEIPPHSAETIIAAKKENRPIIAVGTTSLRALEGVWLAHGRLQPYSGWVDIFLYPGREFHVVDGLITNFHLPGSTLLMLVAAFAGRKRILQAYEEALRNGYNFFSYGDAMLIC